MKAFLSICLALLSFVGFSAKAGAITVGDEILFGAYEQDGDTRNGKEPIEWIVVDVDRRTNTLTAISRYLLDCVPYNATTKKTRWAKTTLNRWLQSSFVPEAFSSTERGLLIPAAVSGEKQSVFIPNESQMKAYFDSYLCEPTEYAISQGCYNVRYNGMICGSYWLRMDTSSKWGTFVGAHGKVYNKKNNKVTVGDNGVRPAILLSMNFDADTPGARAESLRKGERMTVPDLGRVQITGYYQADQFGYFPPGNPRGTLKYYDSGVETEYIYVRMSITNTGDYYKDYLISAFVEANYDEVYKYGGWSYQYADLKSNSVLSKGDCFPIAPGKTGYFCFGCTVPNAVVNSKKPLRMIITIDGNEITYNIRK